MPTPQTHVTIHIAAEELGVSTDTIRRWAKKGLIRSTRSPENHRLFNLKELRRLRTKLSGGGGGKPFRVLKRRGRKTPFKVIELFSGCGGMALGFENAGLRGEMLVEIDRKACATLRQNWPRKKIVEGDVGEVDFSAYRDQIDIVAGGFPCQAFSYAGQGRGFADTRGTLFFEFARCLQEVRPKIAIGENVRGLMKHDDGRTLEIMLGTLRELGYTPHVHILRAQFLDVAQKRERLIIMGVRDDLDLTPLFPAENDYTMTLREVLRGVSKSAGQDYSAAKSKVMQRIPEGGNWHALNDQQQRDYMGASYFLGGGRTGMARRLAWDEPSLTLTCSPAQKQTERCHPEETRPLTTREYARVQSFPDAWEFAGSTSSIYRQIGNAVPVNLAYHLGRCLVAMLDPEEPRKGMFTVEPAAPEEAQLEMAL